MIFTETKLKGAYIIDIERREDPRGFFARTYCRHEFEALGLDPAIAQGGVASNIQKGTLRGMHFQFPPAAETKIVRCTWGAILDVIVDLRPESATFLEHVAVELDEDSMRAVYVPKRFAHGYQTLRDASDMSYLVSEFYAPGEEGGIAFDDPDLGIAWPLPVTAISEKDTQQPRLKSIEADVRRRLARDQ